jgi:FkbM family methyltransferase
VNVPFISYAQNAEDVVLWRVFERVGRGCYVDVGAADPNEDSVTRAFYDAGWRGVNVEPEPTFAEALRCFRPGDVIVQKAAGAANGVLTLHVADGTGLSTLSGEVAERVSRSGQLFHDIVVEVTTLDEILEEAGLSGVEIHFLKIDVEGHESEALEGLTLSRWKPWVLIVEATEPMSPNQSHGRWEGSVLADGYVFALFDGLNRFYVSPDHPELGSKLAYPACVFDQPYLRSDIVKELERRQNLPEIALLAQAKQLSDSDKRANYLAQQLGEVRGENMELIVDRQELRGHLRTVEQHVLSAEGDRDGYHQRLIESLSDSSALRATKAWRITRPLREIRGLKFQDRRAARRPSQVGNEATPSTSNASSRELELVDGNTGDRGHDQIASFELRVSQATQLLVGKNNRDGAGGKMLLTDFAQAISQSAEEVGRLAWLCLVVSDGRYPAEDLVRSAVRILGRSGSEGLVSHMAERFERSLATLSAPVCGLDIRQNVVLVDITHTAIHDLHTGIQRVVRQLCARWFADERVVAVSWNHGGAGLRVLAMSERRRMIHWFDHMHGSGSGVEMREPLEENGWPVVPWGSRLVIPELSADPSRCSGYGGLNASAVLSGLSHIGYDMIPIFASETVTNGLPGAFADYLSNLKYADRLSTISEATAIEFSAFAAALASQGINGPQIKAHALPTDDPQVEADSLAALESELSLDGSPLVLVVGSHEPRKNHLVVLDAAEELWANGHWFHLALMGGSSWKDAEFNSEVERLMGLGRPVHVLKRVTEDRLWAAYTRARFTIFPSLVEGFGLPIVESLRCGTPVITTDYGSMAEVAVGGGALLIDPRRTVDLVAAMENLLASDELLNSLVEEARGRIWKDWDQYAEEVWAHLVPEYPKFDKRLGSWLTETVVTSEPRVSGRLFDVARNVTYGDRKTISVDGKPKVIYGRIDDPYFSSILPGTHSNDFLSFVAKHHLAESSVVLDVGANIGVTATILANAVPEGRVIAFEPGSDTYQYLLETISANELTNCKALPLALGATSGPASFLENGTSGAASHLVVEGVSLGEGNVVVRVRTLDEVVEEEGISRLDLIKISVDGFEVEVIAGATHSIERFRPSVFLEFNTFTLIAYGNKNPRDVLTFLKSIFPHLYRFEAGRAIEITDEASVLEFIHDNLTKRGCVDDLLCTFDALPAFR